MPICFLGWIALFTRGEFAAWPQPLDLFTRTGWIWTVGIFVAFRAFDIIKPWPVRQSQALPGGWGVTVDDGLAAIYVNLVVIVIRTLC
jgi:phosphatidylglycerophosphatase A